MTAKKPAIDWERVEAQFRAGAMSLREIATEHGVTEGAVRKRAKRDDWQRDLKEKVRAKAESLVRKELVRSEVRTESPSERQTVEVAAQVQARIQIAHRADIGRSRKLAMDLLAELEQQTGNLELFEKLGELLAPEPENTAQGGAADRERKLREAFSKALSLTGRTKTMKDLADTLRVLVALEREAFGIGEGAEDDKTKGAADALREFFGHLHAGAGRVSVVKRPGTPPGNPLVKG